MGTIMTSSGKITGGVGNIDGILARTVVMLGGAPEIGEIFTKSMGNEDLRDL